MRRRVLTFVAVVALITPLVNNPSTTAAAIGPALTATPGTGLVDGQTVLIEGTGFEPGALMEIYQCVAGAVDELGCDSHNADFIAADGQGEVRDEFPVDARMYGQDGTEYDCRAEPYGCFVGVGYLLDADEWPAAPLDFDPNAPLRPAVAVAAVPDERLIDAQEVTIEGSNLLTRYDAWAFQCLPFDGPDLPACNYERGMSVVPHADGTATVPYRVDATLRTNTGEAVDCTRRSGACVLVISSGYSFQADRAAQAPLTFGVRDVTDACPADTTPAAPWTDVERGGPHELGIDCVAAWGLARGTSPTTFSPAGTVTRGQAATVLAALIGLTPALLPDDAPDAFPDDEGDVHESDVDRLAAAGLVHGRPDGTFGISDPVTRGQLASLLDNAARYVLIGALPAGPDAFTDDEGDVHEPAIDAMAAAGVAAGTTPTTFGPSNPLRRDQAATFVARLLDLFVEAGHVTPPPPG